MIYYCKILFCIFPIRSNILNIFTLIYCDQAIYVFIIKFDVFQHGKLKDVRLVTYRNGMPKGLAYVEFEDEVCFKKKFVLLFVKKSITPV